MAPRLADEAGDAGKTSNSDPQETFFTLPVPSSSPSQRDVGNLDLQETRANLTRRGMT